MIVKQTTHARVGLLGNPSDGFGGKTIAMEIGNFHATATVWESPRLQIIPHRTFDPFVFGSLQELREVASLDGYYGGTRLVYATCKHFLDYCIENGIGIADRNFTIEYDTTIPRQVGLGGSSAIVVAVLKSLMSFYGLDETDIPKPLQASMALAVEQDELGIQAGLQDRVVQVYGGLVYMDFSPHLFAAQGYGHYETLPVELVPPLYLAYVPYSTMTSGTAHNPVRYRFSNGDPEVVSAMRQFAEFAEEGRQALLAGDHQALGKLMDNNFDLRRKVYGDDVIGPRNLEMIEIARSSRLPAKFPGSGGAVVGIYQDPQQVPAVEAAFRERGYAFEVVTIAGQGIV
jgi:glucuronokinase